MTNGRDLAAALGQQRKTVQIPLGGLMYEVGPDAGLADSLFGIRHLDNDYVLSPEYLALTRGALHYMQIETIDLLVSGLPVSLFASKKTALEKRLTGIHELGRGQGVVVKKVRVLAQPHGALANFALANADQFKEARLQRHLIIDPGARTFDWLVAQGLKTVEKRSGAVDRGMHDVLRVFAEAISKVKNTQFTDYERIDRALRDGTRPIVKPVIQEAFPRHALQELKDGMDANVVGFQLAGMESLRQEEQQETCTRTSASVPPNGLTLH